MYGRSGTEMDGYGGADVVYGTSQFRRVLVNMLGVSKNILESSPPPSGLLEERLQLFSNFSCIFGHSGYMHGRSGTEMDGYGGVDVVYGTSHFRRVFVNMMGVSENFLDSSPPPSGLLEERLQPFSHFSRIFGHSGYMYGRSGTEMDGYGGADVVYGTSHFRRVLVNMLGVSENFLDSSPSPSGLLEKRLQHFSHFSRIFGHSGYMQGRSGTEMDGYGGADVVYGTSYFRRVFLNMLGVSKNFLESSPSPSGLLEERLQLFSHFSRIFGHSGYM